MDNSLQRVKLSVHPSRALVDEEFVILVQNVPPGSPMTLHALHCSEDGHRWEACGHYVADSSGSINGTWMRQTLGLQMSAVNPQLELLLHSCRRLQRRRLISRSGTHGSTLEPQASSRKQTGSQVGPLCRGSLSNIHPKCLS